jgi:hypothetical protein
MLKTAQTPISYQPINVIDEIMTVACLTLVGKYCMHLQEVASMSIMEINVFGIWFWISLS